MTADSTKTARRVECPADRIDTWLAGQESTLSRARWQSLIRDEFVTLNGQPCKANRSLQPGDLVEWTLPPPVDAKPKAEAIPLAIVFEDSDLAVIDKPPGLVVHPAAGNETGTLVNALLHHCNDLAGIGGERRPGIVHRLDKETSGLLVVAKNEASLNELARQFKERETIKDYLALARGVPAHATGTLSQPIGRHPVHRKKMAAGVRGGRPALSRYEIVEALGSASLLRVRIETGRTHQIRVHLAAMGHPVLGDALYGGAGRGTAPRQMLHAAHLEFKHPASGQHLRFDSPLPPDMRTVLDRLRQTDSEPSVHANS